MGNGTNNTVCVGARRNKARGWWIGRVILTAVAAVLLSGCMQAHQLDRLCDQIADEYDGIHFSRDFSLSLGPFSLGLLRFGLGFADDTREAREYLTGVSRIQLAIYKVTSPPLHRRLKMPRLLREMIDEDGWEVAVKTSDKGDNAWILFREDHGKIRDMHITALDDRELVMIRISGRLDELFEKAMKERGSVADLMHSKFGKLNKRHASSGSDDSEDNN